MPMPGRRARTHARTDQLFYISVKKIEVYISTGAATTRRDITIADTRLPSHAPPGNVCSHPLLSKKLKLTNFAEYSRR